MICSKKFVAFRSSGYKCNKWHLHTFYILINVKFSICHTVAAICLCLIKKNIFSPCDPKFLVFDLCLLNIGHKDQRSCCGYSCRSFEMQYSAACVSVVV